MSAASPSRPDLMPSAGRQVDIARARRAIASARRAGRTMLLEPEGLEVLDAIGVGVPDWVFVPIESLRAGGGTEPRDLARIDADRIVVKVVAEGIAHKTELGGVAVVARDGVATAEAMRDLVDRLASADPAGCLAAGFVEHDTTLAGELLVALRWTADFGPVVAVGAGGLLAEQVAADLRPGAALALVPADVTEARQIEDALRAAAVVRLATEPQRGRPPIVALAALVDVVERLLLLGRACVPGELMELEVNPLAVTNGRLVALDVLARLAGDEVADGRLTAPRRREPPGEQIDHLLRPRSIAIVGVSSGEGLGRTILRNTLRDGFEPTAITIVKPGATEIDGCRCVPDLASLPDKVDLLIVAVSAAAAAQLIPEAIDRNVADSVIVIPGGLDETVGGADHARRIHAALAARDDGPILNGGNCMGIRSRPGRYDTLFIPETKLAGPGGRPVPLAIVAQSGAFAISRLSRLEGLDPQYVITVGNQMDLTVGDHLEHLARDESIRVFGVYVEGFAPLDGLRFLRAARRIRDRGGTVVLYRAGRTRAGALASASHTAAIAGDAAVTTTLARSAGVFVADTLEAFDDVLGTLVRLDGRPVQGDRLGAMTNAGFECVTIGDAAGSLELARFDDATAARLEGLLRERRLDGVVEVHNPFDLTPMGDDAAFAEVAETILASPVVDLGVIANVPFAQTMHTLPDEGLASEGAVATSLADLWRRTSKPWVTVVDAGARFDPLARALEGAGIPTFRTIDAAMRTLSVVVATLCPRPGRGSGGREVREG
jgi:acyl-CoA synthetase (NDP forming)